MLAVLDIALQTTRYRQEREERGQRGGEMGGGQKQDTTTVHAPIRKDALLQAGNVAQRLPIVRQIQALGSTRGQHVWFDQKGRFGSRK